MKKIIFAMLFIAALVSLVSCSKEQNIRGNETRTHNTITQNGGNANGQNNAGSISQSPKWYFDASGTGDNVLHPGGGEDDDKPIIHHFAKNATGWPIPEADILMVNNSDSLFAITDSAGYCAIELLRKGNWYLKISREGYYPVEGILSVTDSALVVTTTLELK